MPMTLTDVAEEKSLQSKFIRDEDERPKVSYDQFSDEIPVISLVGIDDDDRKRGEILKKIVMACEDWGIFQVVDHGIDTNLISEMTRNAREFFALPAQEKLRFDMSGGKKGGFIVSSHLQGEAVQDWREIVTYFSYPVGKRDYTRWPDKPESWRKVTEEYSEKLMDLACKLLGVLSEAMGLETEALTKACVDMDQKDKGEGDADLLLETLFAYSAHEKMNSTSSDSFDSLLDDKKNYSIAQDYGAVSCPEKALQMSKSASSDSLDSLFDDCRESGTLPEALDVHPKQEVDLLDDNDEDARSSLLGMKFSVDEVDFAIDKLGKGAPIYELVDFIFAAQIAKSEDANLPNHGHEEKNEDINTESLFGTMDMTLRLLEMGFAEHEVSLAIEKLGCEVPITKLADWICGGQLASSDAGKAKVETGLYPSEVKIEDPTPDYVSQTRGSFEFSGVIPKEEYDDGPSSFMRDSDLEDNKGKRPKQEYDDIFSTSTGPSWKRVKKGDLDSTSHPVSVPRKKYAAQGFNYPTSNPASCRSINKVVAEPPYFFYANVVNLTNESWNKMSQFLYAIQPEFVNTQLFSAFSRKEGYIHNLPTEGRHHIEPKSPLTIEEALPQTKKWWPGWDTRKQLSSICSESSGIMQICDNLMKMLVDSRGELAVEQQKRLLYYCRTLNLVWVGQYKLAPIQIEQLERLLGYPMNHTKFPEISLSERLGSLRNCFQTDALGYHLSVLKSMFPGGVTLLSLYSGIGGAEIALHRLGIYLKGVVSVETSEAKRKMLRRWWQNSGQAGELVQIEDIQKLSSSRLDYLLKKFGGFDIIIGQNPCTDDPKGSKGVGRNVELPGLDFALFFEFVRVQQRVRNMMGSG